MKAAARARTRWRTRMEGLLGRLPSYRRPRECGGPGRATKHWPLDSRFSGNDEDRGFGPNRPSHYEPNAAVSRRAGQRRLNPYPLPGQGTSGSVGHERKDRGAAQNAGIELPVPAAPIANYVPFTVSGAIVSHFRPDLRVERRAPPSSASSAPGFRSPRDRRRRKLCALNILAQLQGGLRRRSRPGQALPAARRLRQLHARLHRHAAGRQRRLRPDGRGVRRCRPPRPRRGRGRLAAGRRRGRGRSDVRDRLNGHERMSKGGNTVTVQVHGAIGEIPAAEWDACAGDINPTVSHAFLQRCEESGSATARTGWAPQHLTLRGPDGRLVGAVPMYLKSHSYGEYIFDYGWADAYERAGGRYYPKLLCAVPFTPVPGPRLLVAPDAPPETKSAPDRRHGRIDPGAQHLVAAHQFRRDGRRGRVRRGRVPAADRPAIPLDQQRLQRFRRLPRRAQFAQAQGGQEGAARGARAAASRSRC